MSMLSKEAYLKSIAIAEAEGEVVIAATLAKLLCVSRPAVTAALKRLMEGSFVRVASDGRIYLTKIGRRIADRLIFRSHLIERMLTEVFEMPWHEVADEAERLEHAVSPAFERRLVRKLGKNGKCAHGNGSTMRSAIERRKRGFVPLDEASTGVPYRIASVYERDRNLLQFFDQEGIRPGTPVSVQEKHYDGTTTLAFRNRCLRLGLPAAKRIWVEKA